MKKRLTKNLPFLFLLLLVFNCSSKTENGSNNLALTSLLMSSDSTSDDETTAVVSKSNYTLSQDLSSKKDVEPEKTEKTVSLAKSGDKYVSDRILLEDLDVGTKFEISSDLKLDFEVYLGIASLNQKEDKQKRLEDLSASKKFKITKKGEKYTVEILTKGSYSLFLVSSSEDEITIKMISEAEKQKENIPTEVVEITETIKTVSSNFLYDISGKWFIYRTPQLAFNAQKGDKIFSSLISPKKYFLRFTSPWYSGTSLFSDEDDMKSRIIECSRSCSNWPTTFSFAFPGTTFHKTGPYSDMKYLYLKDKVEKVEYKIVKISPYVPEIDASITTIGDTFQSINYTLDDRNELVKTYTSNQFILTGVEEGTILITKYHSTKDWDDLKHSELSDMTFYSGTERLTGENIRSRYVPSYKVIDAFKSKKERIYLYGSGDYSIVFTNYSDAKKTDHEVKVER